MRWVVSGRVLLAAHGLFLLFFLAGIIYLTAVLTADFCVNPDLLISSQVNEANLIYYTTCDHMSNVQNNITGLSIREAGNKLGGDIRGVVTELQNVQDTQVKDIATTIGQIPVPDPIVTGNVQVDAELVVKIA